MNTTEKIKATCYGVWGCPYYRTETGHTFSIKETQFGKVVFYYGNVMEKGNKPNAHMLTKEEKAQLFERVEFVR